MIRPATPEDAAAIAVLETQLFGAEAWTEAQVVEELTGVGRAGWVSTRLAALAGSTTEHSGENASTTEHGVSTRSTGGGAGELEGYVITREIGDVVDLQRIGVHPARQRSGLASELLETALAETSAGRMLLEVAEDNEAALAFYAQCGFEEIDRRPRYYRSGADAIVMQAALRGR
jgi:ribosomal-protein-alanine N-acetyltransferase